MNWPTAASRNPSQRIPTLAMLLTLLLPTIPAHAQAVPPAPAPAQAPSDPALDEARSSIGKALFLRCFCAGSHLHFSAAGKPLEDTAAKQVDWTLAAIDIDKVDRRNTTLLLEGMRVALRYNADQHIFERRPQKSDRIHIEIDQPPAPPSARATETLLNTIFSTGIDRPLQLSMPDLWRHYFDPSTPWPADALSSQTIYVLSPKTPEITPPTATRHADSGYTPEAVNEHVHASILLRLVVDTEGQPQRISVARPIGYGLDALAVQALRKWHFTPATKAGQPVAAQFTIEQQFELNAPPHR